MPNCGECTACCTLLKIDDLDKAANTPCIHCRGGCTIYETKPQTCTEFECAYLQAKDVPESLRPDHCGIIFIKRSDRIFSGLLIPDMKYSDIGKQQIHAFNQQGFTVILISLNEPAPHLMLASGHDPDEIMKEYKECLNGNL